MRRSLKSGRMESFSDGVLSIAATLLVFNIALRPPGSPQEQAIHAWPGYLGYAISFLTIGAAWLGHIGITDRLARADPVLLRINLLLLLVVAFLPFPTKLVADALNNEDAERNFVTLYGLVLLTIRLLLFALDAYASRAGLYSEDESDEELDTEHRNLPLVLGGYATAILVGFVLPKAAVGLYFALALLLVVPFSTVRRRVSKRS